MFIQNDNNLKLNKNKYSIDKNGESVINLNLTKNDIEKDLILKVIIYYCSEIDELCLMKDFLIKVNFILNDIKEDDSILIEVSP
jgi:hypothetical protein